MNGREQISPLMHELSAYMARALRRKLPPEVAERARLSPVDSFAAMISGTRLPAGRGVIAYVKPLGGTREAGIIGTRIVTTTLNAALANGMCCHADESDDTHPATCSHPGTSVIPEALAIAEREGLSGEQLLRAVVLGYDICARVALAMKHVPSMRFHLGAHGQLCGAAAAAAALLRLKARNMRYLLAYCAQQASGLFTMLRDSHHIEKAYAAGGMPAHNGVA